MNFTWAPEKDAANSAKHGVSFQTAMLVFDDLFHMSVFERIVDGEERWRTIGQVGGLLILIVAHTYSNTTAKKPSGSYPPEKQQGVKGNSMKKKTSKEIEALAAMNDKDIDTSDIPETLDWDAAEIGKFYRPVKKKLTIRLDADVVEWFKKNKPHYQTAINKALREYIEGPGR